MSLVDQERSYLREERRAYEAFREQVRLATPDSSDATDHSTSTEQLLDAYCEEEMDALDHETVYGDTLVESLEEELSPAIADLLIAKDPFAQRRKRNLLVETTAAIERREEFCVELDDEWEALETFAEELTDVEEVPRNFSRVRYRNNHSRSSSSFGRYTTRCWNGVSDYWSDGSSRFGRPSGASGFSGRNTLATSSSTASWPLGISSSL